MTKKEAIKNTLVHWKRMRRWAKKQKPRGRVNDRTGMEKMYEGLGEDWSADSCDLCRKYYSYHFGCAKCPLRKFGACSVPTSPWKSMARSKTWGTWVRNSDKIIEQLESLL